MVTLDDGVFDELQHLARRRNITIQELFRAILIPDWIERNTVEEPQPREENPTSYTIV